MKNNPRAVSRREFTIGATAAAVLMPIGATVANAKGNYEALLKARTKGAKLEEGKISLKMPDLAENGNLVPFTAKVEGDAANVKAIYVFAPLNPGPEVGQFYFTAAAGEAMVTGLMRMGKTQEIIAVAEMNDGKFYAAKKQVKVTVGGCGG